MFSNGAICLIKLLFKMGLFTVGPASLCNLAGRYHNPIPTRFPALIDYSKIPAQDTSFFEGEGGRGEGHGFKEKENCKLCFSVGRGGVLFHLSKYMSQMRGLADWVAPESAKKRLKLLPKGKSWLRQGRKRKGMRCKYPGKPETAPPPAPETIVPLAHGTLE
jgi:hypothetical protein